MARPRAFDMDATLDGMLDVFWRKGFAGTSIPDLSAATDLLPGSLYAAFGSKDEMFRLSLGRYAAWLAARMPRDTTGLDGIKAGLDTIVRLTVADRERRGCPMLNAIPEANALSSETQADITAGLTWMRRYFEKRLGEALAETKASLDVDQMASVLLAAAVSIRVLGRSKLPQQTLQQIADGATEAARNALATTQGSKKRK
jgi:TetR/AcrR family transcriptional regulator, transcriptional repressor for nem operon